MENGKRDLWVLLKSGQNDQEFLDQTVECLHKILMCVETNQVFSLVHELVTRTHITRKSQRILRAVSTGELKPFQFLINKN